MDRAYNMVTRGACIASYCNLSHSTATIALRLN